MSSDVALCHTCAAERCDPPCVPAPAEGEPLVRLYPAPLTVGELRRALLAFPDSSPVEVGPDRFVRGVQTFQEVGLSRTGETVLTRRAVPRLDVQPAGTFFPPVE